MKAWGFLSLAVILATPSLFGQLHLAPRVDPSQCPVGLLVNQNGRFFAYRNAGSDPMNVPAQQPSRRFDFKMTNLSPRDIVSVDITAHGFSERSRLFPASDPTPDLAKTVRVAFDVKANRDASREVSFSRFSTVRSFDVNTVTYADGSVWRASSPEACSVAPDGIMLISAQ